jgi:hypothetical protein
MSGRAHMQTMLKQTSQRMRETSLLFALPIPTREAVQSVFDSVAQAPVLRTAGHKAKDDTDHPRTWLTHSPLCSRKHGGRQRMVLPQPGPQRRFLADGLQQRVSIERHLSRIHPCFTRSLARRFPRATSPHHAKAACQGPDSAALGALLRLRRPPGLGFQTKISRATCARLRPTVRATFSFGASTESTPAALGAGHTRVASRRSVPSENRANPNRRKDHGTL